MGITSPLRPVERAMQGRRGGICVVVRPIPVELADVYTANEEAFCDTLIRCRDVSLYLLDRAPAWLES